MHTFRNNSFLRLRSSISPLLLLWALQQALVLPGPIIQGNTCTRRFLNQLFNMSFARNWNVSVLLTIICNVIICEQEYLQFIDWYVNSSLIPQTKSIVSNFQSFVDELEIKGIKKCIWLKRVLPMRLNPSSKMKFFQLANATPF